MKKSIFELGYGRYELYDLLKDSKGHTAIRGFKVGLLKKNRYFRRICSRSPISSYGYAIDIDRGPHPLTREGASKNNLVSTFYNQAFGKK